MDSRPQPHPRRGPFAARVVAAGLWLISVLAGIGNIAGSIERGDDPNGVLMFAIVTLDAIACATMGTLITLRRPGNRIGLLLTIAGSGISVTFFSWAYGSVRTAAAGPNDLLAGLLSWSGSVAFSPVAVALGLIVLLFPDGRLPSARWRLPAAVPVAAVVVGTSIQALLPGRVDQALGVNPFGIDILPKQELSPFASVISTIGFSGVLLLGVVAVGWRLHTARGDTRRQMKWFMGAVVVYAVAFAADTASQTGGGTAYGIVNYAAALSIALLPIAIAIAVLRYRLYAIDRIISRTLGWAIVSAVLLGTFAFLVVALQTVLADVTSTNAPAVAASTLVVAALFQPVRRRVQSTVDRRFDRARYDAARVVEGFSGRLRDELDLTTLGGEIERVAAETVRPASARVWLRGTSR